MVKYLTGGRRKRVQYFWTLRAHCALAPFFIIFTHTHNCNTDQL